MTTYEIGPDRLEILDGNEDSIKIVGVVFKLDTDEVIAEGDAGGKTYIRVNSAIFTDEFLSSQDFTIFFIGKKISTSSSINSDVTVRLFVDSNRLMFEATFCGNFYRIIKCLSDEGIKPYIHLRFVPGKYPNMYDDIFKVESIKRIKYFSIIADSPDEYNLISRDHD